MTLILIIIEKFGFPYDWKEIAETVLCETEGTNSDKAEAIKNALFVLDSGYNWIVLVTPTEADFTWVTWVTWRVLSTKDLCGKNLVVFMRDNTDHYIDCHEHLQEKIMDLIDPASQESSDVHVVRELVDTRETGFDLEHHVIFTFTAGSWTSASADSSNSNCHNFDKDGKVQVFYYGCFSDIKPPEISYGC